MKFRFLSLLALASLTLFSCEKSEDNTPSYEEKRVGIYFLSEGSWGSADSKLSYYDIETEELNKNYFEDKNSGSAIGDTAQDILLYGSKTYIIVNGSDKIIVSDSYTGVQIEEFDLTSLFGSTVSPRFAVGAEGKVYVSTWNNGVLAIDTTTLSTPTSIALSGAFSEGILYYNKNLYVANSGVAGDYYGGSGTTISIVSTETETETGTIDVPANPNILKMSADGKMYLSTWGDWWSVDAQLHEVDYTNKTYTTFANCPAGKFAVTDKYIYTTHFSYITYESYNKRVTRSTGAVEDFDVYSLSVVSPYNVNSDLSTNTVFYTCQTGAVAMINEAGELEQSFELAESAGEYLNTNIVKFVDLTYVK